MDIRTYTVEELAGLIGRAVARAFPDEVWVHGEIRDLNRASSGHVYFTLVDAAASIEPPPLLPVTLFASDKVAVNRVLSRSGAVRMTDGVEVRIRGRLSHYAARGTVQLRMVWIDTDFTLGRLAAERDRLVSSLAQRGLLDRNPSLAPPLVPLRVGLVTSRGSAAYADFVHELSESGYAFRVALFDARVQGPEAIGDVVGGLGALGRAEVDVIALVRGGGAQTDLAVFDSEEIVLAIALCPVPVFTGIGHETDVSVADLVARNYKTPTACAAELVARVSGFRRRIDTVAADTRRAVRSRLALATSHLDHTTGRVTRSAIAAGARAGQSLRDAAGRIGRTSRSRLSGDQALVATLQERIGRAGGRQLVGAATDIDRMSQRIAAAGRRSVGAAQYHVEAIEHRFSLLDPNRLLARGWSITRTAEGRLVTDPGEVAPGGALRTTVAGGVIASVVVEEEEEAGRG